MTKLKDGMSKMSKGSKSSYKPRQPKEILVIYARHRNPPSSDLSRRDITSTKKQTRNYLCKQGSINESFLPGQKNVFEKQKSSCV